MSTQWYAWTGPTGAQARLCANCWNYWRKYGGFKAPNKLRELTVKLKLHYLNYRQHRMCYISCL